MIISKRFIFILSILPLFLFISCDDDYDYRTNPNHNPSPSTNPSYSDANIFNYKRNGYINWDYQKYPVYFSYSRVKFSFISSHTDNTSYCEVSFLDSNHNKIYSKGFDLDGDLVFEDIMTFGTLIRYIEVTLDGYTGSLIVNVEAF